MRPDFFKTVGIEQGLNPFAGRPLALSVLTFDARGSSQGTDLAKSPC
jgi:hypothetical protein